MLFKETCLAALLYFGYWSAIDATTINAGDTCSTDLIYRSTDLGQDMKIVCYVALWYADADQGGFNGDDLDPFLCSHYVISYFAINATNNAWRILPLLGNIRARETLMQKVIGLKLANPNLRLLIAIGGYADNNDMSKYSELTLSEENTQQFINETLKYLQSEPLLDGIDFEWTYPGRYSNGGIGRYGADEERKALARFTHQVCSTLKESGYVCMIRVLRPLRHIFNQNETRDAFRSIIKNADLVNIWTADIPPESTTCKDIYHTDSIYKRSYANSLNASHYTVIKTAAMSYFKIVKSCMLNEALVDFFTNDVLDKNDLLSRSKLLLTIPMQANAFSLSELSNSWTKSWTGGKQPQPPNYGEKTNLDCGGHPGHLFQFPFSNVCRQMGLRNGDKDKLFLHYYSGNTQEAPVAYNKDIFVPTNSIDSVQEKVRYAKKMMLGGVSVFQIAADDVNGWCWNQTFPLLNAIFDEVHELGTFAIQ